MGVAFSQIRPPAPHFTEENVGRLNGRVVIVTGATSGVGFELASMLYDAGADVWVGGRTEASVKQAILKIEERAGPAPELQGVLHEFIADLSDLAAVKPAVQRFLAKESRLDALFNNAAVSLPPAGSKSVQGLELMMATNSLASYLLTSLLQPTLQETAAVCVAGSVRVVWTTSQFVELSLPKGGMDVTSLDSPGTNQDLNYAYSKLGNYYLASRFAGAESTSDTRSVLHLAYNPGNLKTNLLRHTSAVFRFFVSPLLYPAKYGALTGLWSGFSSDVTEGHNGSWVIPWGRFHPGLREDIVSGTRAQEGGTSQAQAFEAWCAEKTKNFM